MILTKAKAMEIAQDAMENAGYDITQYVGYYEIWSDDEDPENNWAVAVNKEDNDGHYFAVYMSSPYDEGLWEFTSNLDVNELADLLMKLAENCDIEYKTRQ